ncbi:MAG: DMT family transporter [Nocardioides sp.]|uniref:DMT family transporter n=1 Tax=Nocardioides sp. TaxID=35761 RepID=UPI003D6C5AD1
MYAATLLVVAIAIEVVSTALLPRTEGFRNLGWSAAVLAGYGASIWLLSIVVERMPVSVAYAIWSGLGTALVAAIGVMFLGEGLSAAKAGFLAMIVVGVVGLNLSGAH